jgi:hypothetical protein
MLFADAVLQYYRQLTGPTNLPEDVKTLNPFQNDIAFSLCEKFYHKYYEDENDRVILFGINPGRFGAGLTGVPFTDPIAMEKECGISNTLDKRAELSSKFIYDMINAYGGPISFYCKYYISAVSPLGYVRDGVNLNYYDLKGFKLLFEDYVVEEILKQLEFGIDTSRAYSIGKGQNVKYLQYINNKYQFFDEVIPLPHPRWVMQYRLKRKQEFIEEYLVKLN